MDTNASTVQRAIVIRNLLAALTKGLITPLNQQMNTTLRMDTGRAKSQFLRRSSQLAARTLSPFYRRFPYRGEMDLFKLDPRGAYSPMEPFFYNRIPKAANTTITKVLFEKTTFRPRFARRSDPKYQFLRPLFLSGKDVTRLEREAFKFTFTRNPYSRVLSAYLDKVGRRRHQGLRFLAWAEQHDQPESFLGFCRYLDAGGLFLDMHWAPQVEILCLPLERFDFIGRVETIESDLIYVLDKLFSESPIEPATGTLRAGTHTRASQKISEVYGKEEYTIISRLYDSDFEKLGYDKQL